VNYAIGQSPSVIAPVDLNRDGAPDLVTANGAFPSVSVLLNAADGSGNLKLAGTFMTAGSSYLLAVGDFNGDKWPDVAVGHPNNSKFSALLNDGKGMLLAPKETLLNLTPAGLTAGDFNGDGKGDVVVGNNQAARVNYFAGQGDGTFAASTSVALPQNTKGAVASGDFDGDGKLDLFTGGSGAALSSVGRASQLVAVDLNGDKKLELVFTDPMANLATVLQNLSAPP
jgi:hypothetical protein